MKSYFICLALAMCIISGCTSNKLTTEQYWDQWKSKTSRINLPVVPHELNNEAVIPANFNETWDAAVSFISKQAYTITNIEKASKLITLELYLDTPVNYIDCGTEKVVTADGMESLNKRPSKTPGESLKASISILFKEKKKNRTNATVNSQFIYSHPYTTYDFDTTYVTETRFKKELHSINGEWIEITVPYTVKEPKSTLKESNTVKTYKAMTIYQEGAQCHSTQELEQMILQGIAEELQKEKIQ